MTPYQYRQLKKIWNNIKGDVFDVLCTLILSIAIVMFPVIPMLISIIFR